MSKESQKHSSEKAYRLETPQEHQKFYDDWADSYESQFVESKGYIYPKKIAEYFVNHVGLNHNQVIDIGCGTGLVGLALVFATLAWWNFLGKKVNPKYITGANKSILYGVRVDP